MVQKLIAKAILWHHNGRAEVEIYIIYIFIKFLPKTLFSNSSEREESYWFVMFL